MIYSFSNRLRLGPQPPQAVSGARSGSASGGEAAREATAQPQINLNIFVPSNLFSAACGPRPTKREMAALLGWVARAD